MIARAIAAAVPFKWVAADTVYGVGDIEQQLRQAGKGYVLGVSSAHVFRSWGKRRSVSGTAADIASTRRPSDWKRLSAGKTATVMLERDDFSSNRHPALSFCLSMISAQTLRVCRKGKPVSNHRAVARRPAYPDHAPD